MHRLIGLVGFLFFTLILAGQSRVVEKYLPETEKTIIGSSPVTAIVIKSDNSLGPFVLVELNGLETLVPLDPDAPEFTYFLSLPSPLVNPTIKVKVGAPITLYLINSGLSPEIEGSDYHSDRSSNCPIEFLPVPQAEWRSGLTPPNYSRSFTSVNHVVVHHSAGSNSSTNYTQVVRDIYIYHTEVNGWSDIGYNYLVAQEGTIFAGRDPATGEQDNVLGAHFCGSNSGTMGICILGNYETTTLSSPALGSLEILISFKIQKEGLDPLGMYPHAFGNLPAIIGHRDGCSTACPGENVYALLDEIRVAVEEKLTTCEERHLAFTVSNNRPQVEEYITFTNESAGYVSYTWILENAENETEHWETSGSARWNTPGGYDVTLIGVIGSTSDTLSKEDFISISGPSVFPTLLTSGYKIFITSDEAPLIESVISIGGKEIRFQRIRENEYQLLPASAGIYLVRLSNGDTERIMIL